jgi:YHS domain-containing protein
MVSNVLAPSPARAAPEAGPAKPTTPEPGAGQPAAAAVLGKAVNSVCAICGMPVDPRLPTIEYQGKTIGFGCRMCPPKFKADPERYGPSFLGNQVRPK